MAVPWYGLEQFGPHYRDSQRRVNADLRLLSVDAGDTDLNTISHELLQLALRGVRFQPQQQLFATAAGSTSAIVLPPCK